MRRALSALGVLASVWLAILGVVLSAHLSEQPVYSLPAVAGAATSLPVQLHPITAVINHQRRVALTEDSRLMELAERRAQDMVNRQYYAHQSPEGDDFADLLSSVGLRSDLPSCENLLLTSANQPENMVAEWLASPAHRNCMLATPMTRVGVASVDYGDGFTLAVTIFAADK